MVNQTDKVPTIQALQEEIKRLQDQLQEKTDRLQEAQDTLEAIRTGAVDGIVRSTAEGDQVFLLKGSDEPYRNLIEEMNEGALLISEAGTILFCNHGFSRLVEAPLEAIMGTNIRDWVHPNSASAFEAVSSNPLPERKVFESTFKTKGQKPIATLVSVNKLSLDSINASALIVTDLTKHMEAEVKHYTSNLEKEVTERKKAEEALFEAKGKAEQNSRNLFIILESIPFAVTMVDRTMRDFIYTNANAKALFNFDFSNLSYGDFTAKTKPTHLDGTPYTKEDIPLNRALNGEKVLGEDLIIERDTGESLVVSESAVPLVNSKGLVFSAVAIFIDITERTKAQNALKEAQAKLQEYANNLECLIEERTKKLQDAQRLAAIGQVAGMVGHDIRNPLQAIVGELYFAKDSMKDAPKEFTKEVLESLDFIQEQTDYIGKIVADLQDYAKVLKPEFTSVELCEFISNAVKTILIPDNIQTAFICEKEIPQIKLDKTFTTRILTNLINNAVQAMPKGGKLTLKAVTQDKSAVITVEDTGVGIPEEVKAKMFTPLFTTKSKGQGFGLAVVKRLVEAQGGTIGFESEAGKGTKFTVTLPLTR